MIDQDAPGQRTPEKKRLTPEQARVAFDELTREQREQQAQRRADREDARTRHRLSRMPWTWIVGWNLAGTLPGLLWLWQTGMAGKPFLALLVGAPLGLALGQRIWRYRLPA